LVPGFFVYLATSAPDNVAIMGSSTTDQAIQSAARTLEKRVWDSLAKNNVRQAAADCEQLNTRFPSFAAGWHTASHLAMKLNNAPMALDAIEKALAIDPANLECLLQKGLCLMKLGQMEPLNVLVGQLSSRKMKSPYQCSSFGMLLTRMGRQRDAVAQYEHAARLQPLEAKHYYNLACLQRTLGDIEPSERNFDKTIELNPSDYEAYKVRSELRKQTHDHNHVEELEALFEAGIDDPHGQVYVCYALAKELEDLREAERSFGYLKTGADRRRRQMQYDIQRDLDTIAAIQETFDRSVFDDPIDGDDSDEAVFILGMPRTGTTLVERILSSHSDVFAAGELNNFAVQMTGMVRRSVSGPRVARDELVKLSAELDFGKLGETYIKSTRPLTGHTARFIDKMPLNYLYVGLIHLALPNAKIINLRRNPMDTCYAVYKQLFVDAYPFSYDLDELGQYYVAYDNLMKHWNSVLPGVMHTVNYEDLVSNVEAESKRLVEYCGLEWQPECLTFYKSEEATTTASAAQVRKPVYQSSIGRWRDYEEQLQPVAKILQDAGIFLGG
jgi:tetratricopeptide (TPR) repeat protein